MVHTLFAGALLAFGYGVVAQQDRSNFTIVNGQIYTPGLAIVDAPQPYTPEGGDFLQVALDISGDGRLPFPNNPLSSPTVIQNITLFLSSYITGYNFTISNASAAFNSSPLANILDQEPSSTVKHVNWLWPSCLVGNGPSSELNGSARGTYNISIHQHYRLNGSEYYTILDLPIYVTNEIPEEPSTAANSNDPPPGPTAANGSRIECSLLENRLLDWDLINASMHVPRVQPYLGGSVALGGSGSAAVPSSSTASQHGGAPTPPPGVGRVAAGVALAVALAI